VVAGMPWEQVRYGVWEICVHVRAFVCACLLYKRVRVWVVIVGYERLCLPGGTRLCPLRA
jgi:hypothetical protein